MSENPNQKNNKKESQFISLSEASKETGYTPEHLNLLCRKRKLKGKKIGRNWFTTKEWMEDFILKAKTNKKGGGIFVSKIKGELENESLEEKLKERIETLKIEREKNLAPGWPENSSYQKSAETKSEKNKKEKPEEKKEIRWRSVFDFSMATLIFLLAIFSSVSYLDKDFKITNLNFQKAKSNVAGIFFHDNEETVFSGQDDFEKINLADKDAQSKVLGEAIKKITPGFDVLAQVNKPDGSEIADGDYEIKFSLYNMDRLEEDPYPSESDESVWNETQTVNIKSGVINTRLGIANSFPKNLDPGNNEFYLGVRIGEDAEMVPRKKIKVSPLALYAYSAANAASADNALALNGATVGTSAGNILALGANGKVNIKNLPTGKSGNTLVLSNDSRLETQETDLTLSGDYDYISVSGDEITLSQINLLTDVSGTLPIVNGGTNSASIGSAGAVVYSDGTKYNFTTQGSAGQVLLSNGSGAPYWGAVGGAITPNSIDFTELKDDMTLDNDLTISASASNYSINFDGGTLFLDTANNRVGMGTTAPGQKLSVAGTLGILEGGVSPEYYTILQGGNQSQNLTYTLPTSYPAANGYILTSTTGGVFTWTPPGAASIAMGGSISGGAEAGSVLFIDSLGNLGQDNDYFYYNELSHRLGIGLGVGDTNPQALLSVGTGSAFQVDSSGNVIAGSWNASRIDISSYTNLAVGGTMLQLSGDTISLKEGTLTDGRLCTYVEGTGLVCTQDPTSVGHTAVTLTGQGYLTIDGSQQITVGQIGLGTTNVTGILAIANGGTGIGDTPVQGQLLIGNSSGGYSLGSIIGGTNMQVVEASGSITINNTIGVGGTMLQIAGNTISLREGTLTNNNLCTYVSGTGMVCNQVNNATNWDAGYTYRVIGAGGTAPLHLSITSNTLSGYIDDATTATKGIASFDATNFSVSSGAVNTIQNINSTATPTFGGLTLNGQLTSNVTTGTAPFIITSTTQVNNLNANYLQGHDASYFQIATSNIVTGTGVSGYAAYWNGSGTLASEQYLSVSRGGTGIGTTTTDGKLLIGNSSGGYNLANLTAGTGITISNGSGFITINATASGVDHNSLSGLQGGTTNEYYHLTSTQYSALHSAVTLNTSAHDYLSLSTQQITLGTIDISDDTNLAVGGTMLQISGDTLSLREGVLTNGKVCKYVDGVGLVCNTDESVLGTNYWQRNGTLLSPAAIGDYVGIGTSSPGQTLSVNGTLGIAGSTAPYYTIFTGGAQTQDITYTLPTSYPASNGYILSSATNGTLSWVSAGAASIELGSSIGGGGLPGSVLFIDGAGELAQDNPNFYWDYSSHYLGIGTSDPLYSLDISGTFRLSSTAPIFGSNTITIPASGTMALGTGVANQVAYWSSANTLTGENYLSVSRGGTGIGTTPAQGQLLIGNSTGGYNLAGITGGTGIQVVGGSGTITLNNTDLGSSQYIFKNIAVGSTTVQADSNSDTLTFSAGTNITLTADEATDTITINTAGITSGTGTQYYVPVWSSSNSFGLSSIYNNATGVGIGTTNPLQKLSVNGTLGIAASNPQYYTIFQGGNQTENVTYTLPAGTGSSGQFLKINSSGILSWATVEGGTGGIGTVTSITAGDGLTVSVGSNPITDSGTLAVDLLGIGVTSATTYSYSGMEIVNNQLSLLHGCSNTQVLSWDAGNQRWKCDSVSGIGGITGSGSSGYITKWDGTSTLTISSLFENGTGVGIGTTDPQALLSVGSSSQFQVDTSGNVTGGTYNGNTITAGTGTITLNNYTLTLNGSAALNQNLQTSNSPTFAGLTLNGQLTSNVTTGTAPFIITSTTQVNNLNANYLQGHDASYFQIATSNIVTGTGVSGYAAYWNGSGTLASEQYLSVSRGGTGIGTTAQAGQLLIGNSTGGYTLANLTAGTNMQVVNASGAITINNTIGVGGTMLQMSGNTISMREGILTNNNLCTYVSGTGMVCNQVNNAANWDAGYTYRVIGAGGTAPLHLSITSNTLSGYIDDATTATKGIASFNATNFSVSSGAVNTIQNINSTATPTFGGLTLNGQLTSNVITGTSPFVISSTTQVNNLNANYLQGHDASYFQIATSNIVTGTGVSGYAAYWSGSGTLASEQYLSVSRGGTGIGSTAQSGQLLIGKSDGGYNLATLTAGTGVSINSESGAITITSTLGDSIDIATETNLGVGGTILQLVGSTLSLREGTMNVGDLCTFNSSGQLECSTGIGTVGHDAVTLTGQTYLTINGSQQITVGQIGLGTTNVTGILAIANGGTGIGTTPVSGQILIGNSSGGYTLAQIQQGTGIGITSASGSITIYNSDLGSSQYIFKNIAVGSTTVQADSNSDTLTLSAGTNITLTADETTDTITINTTGITSGTGTQYYVPRWSSATGFELSSIYNNATGVGIGTTNPTGIFEIGIGATTPLFISTGGNVAVGTTSPDTGYRFYVDGNARFNGNVRVNNVILDFNTNRVLAVGVGSDTADDFNIFANGTNRITIANSSGYVGIGTTDPQALLSVGASSQFQVDASGNVTGGTYNGVTISGNGTLATGSGSYTLTIPATGTAALGTGSAGAVAYWSTANTLTYENYLSVSRGGTGIGDTNPGDGKLLIGNGTGYTLANLTAGTGVSISNGSGTITINATGGTSMWTDAGSYIYPNNYTNLAITDSGYMGIGTTSPTGIFEIGIGATTPFFVSTGGNVGIGTTNPTVSLDVIGIAKVSQNVTVGSNAVVASTGIYNGSVSNAGYTFTSGTDALYLRTQAIGTAMAITSNGYVGIGTTDPQALLSVGASSQFQVDGSGSVTAVTYNGNTITSGTGTITLNNYTLTLNGSSTLNQNLQTSDSPTFAGLTLNGQLTSNVVTGTSPFSIASTTLVTNLNADKLDGYDASYFQVATSNIVTGSGVSGQVAYWNGTNTISGENYLSAARGGVGVDGSTAPNGTLLIGNGTGYALATLTAGTGVSINNASGSITINATGGTSMWTDAGSYIYPNNYTNLAITDSGYMGIGTTNPGALLDIGSTAPTFRLTDADGATFQMANNNNMLIMSGTGGTAPNLFTLDLGNNRIGIGNSNPYGFFSIGASSQFQVSSSGIIGLGGTTPLFSMGIDTTDSNKFKIYSGSSITGTSEFTIDENGVTSIANLEMGELAFSENAGAISWVDMSVTSSAADGTVESYTASLDGNAMLTIYGLSDGAGGVDNLGVGISATTPAGLFDVGGLFTVKSSGYVGIGTTSPSAFFSVGASSQFQISSAGIITSGSWNGGIIGIAYGGTGIGTTAQSGQLLIGNSSGGYDQNYLTAGTGISISNGSGSITINATGGTSMWTDAGSYIYPNNYTNLAITDSGYMGIGTTNPTGIFQVGIGATTPLFVNATTGYVGIGTTSPSALFSIGASSQFQVDASGNVTGGTYNGVTISGDGTMATGAGSYTFTIPATGTAALGTGSAGAVAYWSDTNTLTYENYLSVSRGGTGIGTTAQAGQLLIGTSAGGYNLATLTSGTGISISSASGAITINTTGITSGTGTQYYVPRWSSATGFELSSIYNNATGVGIGTTNPTGIFQVGIGATTPFFISTAGKVGIGTTSPTYGLHVAGAAADYLSYIYNGSTDPSAGGIYIRSDGTGNLLTLNYAGSDIFTVNSAQSTFSNPVSFAGTGDISVANDIVMTNSTAGNILFQGPGYVKTDSVWQNLDLTLSAANTGEVIIDDEIQITGARLHVDGTTGYVGIGTSSPTGIFQIGIGATTPLFVSATTGYVGIGTTNPGSYALRVGGNGNAMFDSNVYGSSALFYGFYDRDDSSYYINPAGATSAILAGKVGIGTTSPTGIFEIGIGATTPLFVSSSGYVGINTTNPGTNALYVNGAGYVNGLLDASSEVEGTIFAAHSGSANTRIRTRGSSYNIDFESYNYNVLMRLTNSGYLGLGTTNPTGIFQIGIGATTPLFVSATTGYVGIGTTNPTYALEVGNNGSINVSNGTYNISGHGFAMYASGKLTIGDIYGYGFGLTLKASGSNPINFIAGGSERMYINSSGYIGIGTTSPTGIFEIGIGATTPFFVSTGGKVGIGTTNPVELLNIQASSGYPSLLVKSTASSGNGAVQVAFGTVNDNEAGLIQYNIPSDSNANLMYMQNKYGGITFNTGTAGSASEYMRITSAGKVGIGTTDPGVYKIYINGTGYLNDTAWNYSSDRRLKENIETISYGLGAIMSLRPVSFDYKTGTKNQLGFIAQEVQEVIPEIVGTRPDGMLTLKTDLILPITVKAIQELASSASEQQQQIAGITDQIQINNDQILQLGDENISTNDKIDIIGNTLTSQNEILAELQESDAAMNTAVGGYETRIKALEDQMVLFEEANQAVIDFAKVFDPELMVMKDVSGNIDLGDGKLEADGVVAGAFTVKVVSEEKKTIGSAEILPVAMDNDDNGNDDWLKNEVPMDDPEVVARDGKSVFVETKAASDTAKIFVTAKTLVDKPLSVTKVAAGSGFKVEVKDALADKIEFDWWIVETD